MISKRRSRSPDAPILSLEEHLHIAHDQFVLLADLFDLQAIALDDAWDRGFSSAACRALTVSCRRAGDQVRALLDALPADLMNWTPNQITETHRRPYQRKKPS